MEAFAKPAEMKPDGHPLVVIAHTDSCHCIDLLKEQWPRLLYVCFKGDEERKQYCTCLNQIMEENRLLGLLFHVYESKLAEWTKDKPEVVVFSANLNHHVGIGLITGAYSTWFPLLEWRRQSIMSVGGGMTCMSFCSFMHTYAVFIYRRVLDLIFISIAYSKLTHAYICVPTRSHALVCNIAIMCILPSMAVFETSDATEVWLKAPNISGSLWKVSKCCRRFSLW